MQRQENATGGLENEDLGGVSVSEISLSLGRREIIWDLVYWSELMKKEAASWNLSPEIMGTWLPSERC